MVNGVAVFTVVFYILAAIGYVCGLYISFLCMMLFSASRAVFVALMALGIWFSSPIWLFFTWAESHTGAEGHTQLLNVLAIWCAIAAAAAAGGGELAAHHVEEKLHEKAGRGKFWLFLLTRAVFVLWATMSFAVANGIIKSALVDNQVAVFALSAEGERMMRERADAEAKEDIEQAKACQFYLARLSSEHRTATHFHFESNILTLFWSNRLETGGEWLHHVWFSKTTPSSQEIHMPPQYLLTFEVPPTPSCSVSISSPLSEFGFGGADIAINSVTGELRKKIAQLAETAKADRDRPSGVFTFAYLSALEAFAPDEPYLRPEPKSRWINWLLYWAEIILVVVVFPAISHSALKFE